MMIERAQGHARVSPKGPVHSGNAAFVINPSAARAHHGIHAFTFVEILAAMAFLAILIPAVVTAFSQSNRAAVAAERTSVAVRLCENQMNELLIGSTWQSSGNSGTFSADYSIYRWETSQTSWLGDSSNPMTELTVHVYFPVQGKEHEVKLTTLVNNTLTQP